MNWAPYSSQGVTLDTLTGGEFTFVFPDCGAGSVNYITRPWGGLKPSTWVKSWFRKLTIAVTYKITTSGSPKFKSLDSTQGLLPNFRPMLERADDPMDWSHYRWWPTGDNCCFLTNSSAQVYKEWTTDLSLWSTVDGHVGTSDVSGFKAALRNLGHVGLTFGGGNSFGHGVCVTGGAARFYLLSFTIK